MEKKSPNYLKKKQKNNSRAFIVLCNNVQFFHHFCKWFPKEEFTNYDFYVVFDNRLNDISKELELVRDSTDNVNIKKFNIINGDEIIDFYKDDIKFAYKNKFVLQTLKDIYFLEEYDEIFQCDEDVVIFRKSKLFDTNSNVIWVSGNLSEKVAYEDFLKNYIFKYTKQESFYPISKVPVIHAGQYFMNKSIYETYYKAHQLVYNNEIITDLLVNEKRAGSPNGFIVDNMIIRMALTFFKVVHFSNIPFAAILGNKYLTDHNCRLTKKTFMFHYAASMKPQMYELLEKTVLNKLFKTNEISIECDNLTTISRKYFDGVKV